MISASERTCAERKITSDRAQVHGRLGQRRGGRYASSHGQHGARAQRLPQHEQEIIEGCYDARDVSQEAFGTSTYKSGAGVLQWLGGVMVASLVWGELASVRFRAEPSGERRRPANPHRRCNFVATDIFGYCPSSAGAGAPPRPLLVSLSQKSSSARGPGPRRVEQPRTSFPPRI